MPTYVGIFLMHKIYLFLHFFLLTLSFGYANNIYIVEDVKVTIENKNTIEAKNEALLKAQIIAWETLQLRIDDTNLENIKVEYSNNVFKNKNVPDVNFLNNQSFSKSFLNKSGALRDLRRLEINDYIESIQINSEKFSGNVYTANFTIYFSEKYFSKFFKRYKLKVKDNILGNVYIIPIYEVDGNEIIDSSDNVIQQYIEKFKFGNNLIKFLPVKESNSNLYYLRPNRYTKDELKYMYTKGFRNVIFFKVGYIEGFEKKNLNFDISGYGEKVQDFKYFGEKNVENLDYINEIIFNFENKLNDFWNKKLENKNNKYSVIQVLVNIENINDWYKLYNDLSSIENVKSINLNSVRGDIFSFRMSFIGEFKDVKFGIDSNIYTTKISDEGYLFILKISDDN